MLLQGLEISNFRNIAHAQLDPSSGLNLITGPNASGKTALLEAIYYLSWARSFRSTLVRSLIKHEALEFSLIARLQAGGNGRTINLGIKRSQQQILIRCQGETIHSSSLLTQNFPVLFLGADSFKLLTDGPRQRRRLMDWCLFHVEQDYLTTLRKYQHVLSQRNAVLRQTRLDPCQLRPWDSQLAPLALCLHHYRQEFIPHFEQHLRNRWAQMGGHGIGLTYLPGWDVDSNFTVDLERRTVEDIKRGYTRHGPHNANILFRVDGRSVTQSLSRGQLKRFIACVILTQADIYRQFRDESPCLLIDDLPAELDAHSRTALLEMIHATGLQVFVTATDENLLGDLSLVQTLFHVEHGKLDKVVS